MYSLTEPSDSRIRSCLAAHAEDPFSYAAVGATRTLDDSIEGYVVDHNRVALGRGRATFEMAKRAVLAWEMFSVGWVRMCGGESEIRVGTTVGVLVRLLGVWSLNLCRVVYRVEEEGDVDCFGFAYGTLPDHAASGEERFLVRHDRATDAVEYDLLAFSRPEKLLSKVGYPYARHLQGRFARDSLAAMVRATAS